MQERVRLGWLGPALAAVGIAVGIVGGIVILRGRPSAGAVLDTIAIDHDEWLVVRAEDGGDRNFIELHRHGEDAPDELVWQALVPPYGGRPGAPGLAWSNMTISIRVVRDGHAEVFAVARDNASKLGGFRLAPNHGNIVRDATGPVTLGDRTRSYEFVAGPDWHQLVGIDLQSGEGIWRTELGPEPVDEAGLAGDALWVRQGKMTRWFRLRDGVATDRHP